MKLLKNPYLHLVLYSLSITTIVSSLTAAAVYTWTTNFKGVFLLATATQFLVFFLYNAYLQKQEAIEINRQELEYSNKDIKVSTRLNCAYCKTADTVVVNISKSEPYTCVFCKQQNNIKVQIIPTQTITPVENIPSKIIATANNN